jgi:uncharacterized membrane protein (UPF0127 family)
MKEINIRIGNKPYKVHTAFSEEEKAKGLQGIEELPEKEGMLFYFDSSEEMAMWMKDTLIPLDLVFIDEDLLVTSVHKGEPMSEDLIVGNNVEFVLEINADSGIKVNDELEFAPDKKVRSDKMAVLDENGDPQMELDGGERIFSRPNTKILIKFAKKAYSTEMDKDYKALGKRVFKFLKKQDDTDPEYID